MLIFVYYVFFFYVVLCLYFFFFFFQAEDGIRDRNVTGVQTCALPIYADNKITINSPTKFLTEPRQVPNAYYDKVMFERKLYELGLTSPFSRRVMRSEERRVGKEGRSRWAREH